MLKFFEWLVEVISLLQIVISLLLIGLGIGAIIYFPNPTHQRLFIGLSISVLGLITGIIWARKVWKSKEGAFWFISRINSTQDLDTKEGEAKDID